MKYITKKEFKNKKKKTEIIDILAYENTDKNGIYWVAFTEIAFDAFKKWIGSVALASTSKVRFKTEKKVVYFRNKRRKKND